jgi:hypothetical protein
MTNLSKQLVTRFQAAMFLHYKEVLDYTTAESQLKELAELLRLTIKCEVRK